jgi:hypothetical protein
MRTRILLLAAGLFLAPAARADWVEFVDATATRLVADEEVGSGDVEQKAYAWGDVDHDGDVDLVVARKKPGNTTLSLRTNVLFLNEDGVLTDRTAEFATASTAEGDQGFLTATNDQDAILVDVNLDGWLDVVTATTLTFGPNQNLGLPRVYVNLGCTEPCNGTADWLGFRFEPGRIPWMLTYTGESGEYPCFTHVDAGDVDGDGYPDLWFMDSNIPFVQCADAADYNNKLLLNLGPSAPGYFIDVTSSTFSNDFPVSFYPASGLILDLNGDGLNDLIKQDLDKVDVAYNFPEDAFGTVLTVWEPGVEEVNFVVDGDLNRDHVPDLVVPTNGQDYYLLNTGNSSHGEAEFLVLPFWFDIGGPGHPGAGGGQGGDSRVADLDNDGWNDVVIADVPVDAGSCNRRMHLYRNLGGLPGDEVILQEHTSGPDCDFTVGNPPTCIIAGIPSDKLEGVHDVAIFDIDGDGWKDLVVGRCASTEVYLNQPPGPPAGSLDVEGGPGSQLHLAKAGSSLTLSWGASCVVGDTDYSVYQGVLAAGYEDHLAVTCSTAGATTVTFEPLAESAYYLVVAHNGIVEGSYGTASSGEVRAQGPTACLPRHVAECP